MLTSSNRPADLTIGPARISVIYAVVASLWILLSDFTIGHLTHDAETLTVISAIKGWLFVGLTSVLLFGLIHRLVTALHHSYAQTVSEQGEKLRAVNLINALIEQSKDAIFIKDCQGRYLMFNQEASRVVGHPSHTVIGQDDTAIFPPEQAALIQANDRRIIDRKCFETIEEVLSTADGLRTFLATKGPVYDSNQTVIGLLGISRDISDRVAAEERLREKNALLQQSNEDLEQFATIASHDLQTPLRNIVSYAQLLSHRYTGKLDSDADDFIRYIVSNGKQMSLLINDVLEYARITHIPCVMEPIQLADILEIVIGNLSHQIRETGATLQIAAMPVIAGEMTLLLSLFQNLLDNALKYRTPERPPHITITASQASAQRVQIAVSDNGIGIDPQYFGKIFDIFQRLAPAVDNRSTGIGLTLCRRIVHRLGGTIWVESTPGQGSTFYLTLPLYTTSG